MDGRIFNVIIQFVGVALIVLGVADVYMTVLYARAGTGPISTRLGAAAWDVFRRAARAVPRCKDVILSACGPTTIVLLMAAWIACLLFGFTLIAWPALGTGIRSQSGDTPTDFLTAFYFAGASLTTVGSSDLRAVGPLYRVLTVLDSVLGICVLTLTLSYIHQIYTALARRDALALGLHHASAGTGDAAALLAGLGAGDDFSRGQSSLALLAGEVTAVYESHHFYSVLAYFRFEEPHYAMARGTLVAMELVTLVESALDEQRHGWLRRSASVTQLREGTMHVLSEFAGVYLPGGPPALGDEDGATLAQWRRRYDAAVDYLGRAGIATTRDPQRGADRYVELRRQWDAYVMAFAHYMEHTPEDIDPAGTCPQDTGRHREMPNPPLRAAG
jgi:hypothetical protein